MSAEPLRINDERFLVNRLIGQAPTRTMVREFFMNAQEAASLATTGRQEVKIYPTVINGIRKLTFWNTGPGMDAGELRTATNLSSSINKPMALDGNFGVGAKVSGLAVSPAGIRYRSCKNGVVHQVEIGFDEDQGTYVRFAFKLRDGSDTVIDVTESAVSDGARLDFDWTEVVLIGEDNDHDTVAQPIGRAYSVDRSYITSQIFYRFSEFKNNVDVKIDVSMTKGGGKEQTGSYRTLKTLNTVISENRMTHEIVRDSISNVEVHYIHDPKSANSSHSLSALKNPATQSIAFCALVHKNERYDFKSKKHWSAVAPNFGIPFGSTELTIEIIIPDAMALPNQYRDGLTLPDDRSPLKCENYSALVRELMPDWVKEVIRKAHPPTDDNLDDLQRDLQKLLDEFKVPTVSFAPTRNEQSRVESTDAGIDESEATDGDQLGDVDDEQQGSGNQRGRKASKRQVRLAPEGSKLSKESRALERVPQIEILTDSEEIEAKGLKGRAGKFYKDAQTLFVNGKYSAVNRMANELELSFAGQADPEEIRAKVLKAAQRFTAFRVGKATCYAISKRIADDWTIDDLDRATSPESLSLAADDYRQSINAARKWIRTELKAGAIDHPELIET